MQRNRRQFSRVPFQAEARLILSSGRHAVELVDISLKGALIKPVGEMFAMVGANCQLAIRLDDGETKILMDATIVHHQGIYYGLACREIDLDSITNLRQVIASNLGDDALLEREISLLAHE